MEFSNGKHLLDCETHICNSSYFKCPGSHCIPWQYLCNGRVDCPGGIDEEKCDRASCPGLYMCNNSVVCIHPDQLCDGQLHCPWGDDEAFCLCGGDEPSCVSKVPRCPSKCSYCVPVRHVCDTTWDCPYGEDEHGCKVNCAYLFWCPIEQKCLSFVDLCDGRIHCKDTYSDELFCEVNQCPEPCFASFAS